MIATLDDAPATLDGSYRCKANPWKACKSNRACNAGYSFCKKKDLHDGLLSSVACNTGAETFMQVFFYNYSVTFFLQYLATLPAIFL